MAGIGPVAGQTGTSRAQRTEGDTKSQTFLKGQVVTGKVVQLGAESAAIQVGGRLFSLPPTASLVVGQQLSLLVKEGGQNPSLVPLPGGDGEGGGADETGEARLNALLRSLGLPVDEAHREALREMLASGRPIAGEIVQQLARHSPRASRDASRREATDTALAKLLESIDLPLDEQHLLAARQLLARGIPITKDNVQRLIRTLAQLGANSEADFEAAAYLRANNLPITGATLELTKAMLRDPNSLGRQLYGLKTALATLADALESCSHQGEQARVGEMRQLVEKAAQQLSQRMVMSEGEDRSRLVVSLRRLFTDQGTSLEARLSKVLAGEIDISELEGDLRALLGRLIDTAQTVAGEGRGDAEIRRAAGLLRATATELADGLQAQQLRNVAEPTAGAAHWLSFQLPVSRSEEGHPRMAELRIGGDASGQIDPNRLNLVLRVDLEQLKRVEIRLQISGQQLFCNLASDRGDTLPLLKDGFDTLRQALDALGYSVISTGFELLDPQDGLADADIKEAPKQLSRIDVRI
ncbi:MAG: flagellar hook-length control protein FliK [Chloroflexota bacterium]